MKYSFKCPAPCNYEIKVDAQTDDDAVNKIMAAGQGSRKGSSSRYAVDVRATNEGHAKGRYEEGIRGRICEQIHHLFE